MLFVLLWIIKETSLESAVWREKMTQNEKDIVIAATSLARRINIHAVSRSVSVSMFWGMGVATIFIVMSKFLVIPISLLFGVATILGVSLLTGVLKGILARLSVLEAAMTADAQLDLMERLSSGLELLEQENTKEMIELQLEDAADCARSLDQKAVCRRMFPMTARVLPLALVILTILMYILSPYGQAAQIPEEIRQTIEQTGADMELAAAGIDRKPLSDRVAEMASKMETKGRELQDKPLTKKEVLKDLSNLGRETEVLKTVGEIAEKLEGDMSPEERRALNELLKKLTDDLKDMPQMTELSEEALKALQANLSAESLKDLAAALEQLGIKPSDTKALQKMMEQLAKGKRDVAQSMVRSPKTTGGSKPSELTAAEESGLMGSGAPGKKTAKEMKEEIKSASYRPITSGQGYDSELEGQLSENGKGVTTESESEYESGESTVPYRKVYVEYRDAADDFISKQEIPWVYQKHVKNYFDAIRPKGD